MLSRRSCARFLVLLGLFYAAVTVADEAGLERCLLDRLEQAAADTPVSDLRAQCRVKAAAEISLIGERLFDERLTEDNPFVITPHKPNYVLPLTYNTHPNNENGVSSRIVTSYQAV